MTHLRPLSPLFKDLWRPPFCKCVGVLPVCVPVSCACNAPRGQKGAWSDPLELESYLKKKLTVVAHAFNPSPGAWLKRWDFCEEAPVLCENQHLRPAENKAHHGYCVPPDVEVLLAQPPVRPAKLLA